MILEFLIPLAEISFQQIDTPRSRMKRMVPFTLMFIGFVWLISSISEYFELKALKGTQEYKFSLAKFVGKMVFFLLFMFMWCVLYFGSFAT